MGDMMGDGTIGSINRSLEFGRQYGLRNAVLQALHGRLHPVCIRLAGILN